MKTKIYFLATTLLLLFGCDKAEVNYTEVELIVSSELLFAIDPISTIETSYLQVKEIGAKTDYWLNIYGIKGFEYEPGYEYLLRTYKKTSDKRLQDIPNVEYTLIIIISKTKKQEES